MGIMDPSARIQLRARSELQPPGTCYVCGNGTCDDGYLDFGTFVDFHGSFYLCLTCATQLAEVIGWFSPAEVQTTQALMETLKTENESLMEELNYARPIVDAVRGLAAAKSSSGALDSLVEDAQGHTDDAEASSEGQPDGEPDTPQPFSSTGRSDASGTAKRNFTVH